MSSSFTVTSPTKVSKVTKATLPKVDDITSIISSPVLSSSSTNNRMTGIGSASSSSSSSPCSSTKAAKGSEKNVAVLVGTKVGGVTSQSSSVTQAGTTVTQTTKHRKKYSKLEVTELKRRAYERHLRDKAMKEQNVANQKIQSSQCTSIVPYNGPGRMSSQCTSIVPYNGPGRCRPRTLDNSSTTMQTKKKARVDGIGVGKPAPVKTSHHQSHSKSTTTSTVASARPKSHPLRVKTAPGVSNPHQTHQTVGTTASVPRVVPFLPSAPSYSTPLLLGLLSCFFVVCTQTTRMTKAIVFFPRLANLAKWTTLEAISLGFATGLVMYVSLVLIYSKTIYGNFHQDGDGFDGKTSLMPVQQKSIPYRNSSCNASTVVMPSMMDANTDCVIVPQKPASSVAGFSSPMAQNQHDRDPNLDTPAGKATILLQAICKAAQNLPNSPTLNLRIVAEDSLWKMWEHLLTLQERLQKDNRCLYAIDIGFHYTSPEAIEKIKLTGLMTKSERQSTGIDQKIWHGNSYGDGIYTGNSCLSFQRYGGRTTDPGYCIIVARLIGKCSPRSYYFASATDLLKFNTIIGNKEIERDPNGYYDEVVLRSRSQVVPLIYFNKAAINIDNPPLGISSTIDHNLGLVYCAAEKLQQIISGICNQPAQKINRIFYEEFINARREIFFPVAASNQAKTPTNQHQTNTPARTPGIKVKSFWAVVFGSVVGLVVGGILLQTSTAF